MGLLKWIYDSSFGFSNGNIIELVDYLNVSFFNKQLWSVTNLGQQVGKHRSGLGFTCRFGFEDFRILYRWIQLWIWNFPRSKKRLHTSFLRIGGFGFVKFWILNTVWHLYNGLTWFVSRCLLGSFLAWKVLEYSHCLPNAYRYYHDKRGISLLLSVISSTNFGYTIIPLVLFHLQMIRDTAGESEFLRKMEGPT